MKLKDQESIQLHDNMQGIDLVGVSNTDGIFAYFVNPSDALNFALLILNTHRRLEILLETIELSENDQTSYNEIERIKNELSFLNNLYK